MKKIIAAVSTLFIAVALSVVAVAAPASAHTATLSGTAACNAADGSATVTWTIDNDYPELLNVTASNNAAIPVNSTVAATSGSGDTTKTFTQIVPAPAAGVTVSATVSFLWSGDSYTQNNTKASVKVSSDCKVPTPKDATAAIIDTPASCTVAETVTEGAVVNATWTHSHVTSTTYSFTATANSGHEFSNGQTTESFSGNLNPKLGGLTCDNTSTKAPLCYVTGNNSNPYGSESLSYATILAGVNSGDIIPPFNYIKNGVNGSYPGQNWDATHQAIYNNGCQVPPPPVCIPNSSVTFHYSQNDANDGYIVVTDTGSNSSHVLCNPFWVTATSWTFTTNTSVWPQNRDVVDKLGEISGPGTYDFAAQVTCGQGDIYASFDSTAPSLNPGPVLDGPSNPFVEHFLSDMGFSGSATPTYTQDSASCFKFPETGTPSATVYSCDAGSSNTLTLPAVPGGVWTVTSADYNHTYPIGTGVTDFTPTFFETYTIVLSDGDSTDGYLVTGTPSTWTPVNPASIDCNKITTPANPTAVAITQCGFDGSITIPDTTGVVYWLDGTQVSAGEIDGLSGHHTVTATPAGGYEFTAGATTTWHFNLHKEKTCTATFVVGGCTADGSDSSVPVSVVLDNKSSSVSSSFVIVIDGVTWGTVVVPAHHKLTQPIGSSSTAGETVDVYINGSEVPVEKIIYPFDGCVPATPADPTFTTLTCTGSTAVGGSISTDGNPDLTYTLYDADNTTLATPVSTFPSLPSTPTIAVDAGTYYVHVTANPGFVLAGDADFPFVVTLPSLDCSGTPQTPEVSWTLPSCDPPVHLTSGEVNADIEVQGQFSITPNANIDYTISNGGPFAAVPASPFTEPDGTYTVVGTLTPTAIAAGFTFADPGVGDGYTLNADKTIATWTDIEFGPEFCPPTLATWEAGATSSNATCAAPSVGTITLDHATGEGGKVDYVVTNDATSHVVYSGTGSSDTVVDVAPGHYTVTATPAVAGDGISGDAGPYHVTVAAAGLICGNLAFTGGTIGWFGFALAGGMLFLGIAFLYMKRRGNRTAE